MTKSTITRERLAKIKSWRETYGAGSNVMLPAEEAEELARIALAAMNGEPVAEVLSNRPGNDTSTIDRALPVGTQLYLHAQPEPVVPDAATAIRACLSEFPESARDIVEECADIAENACRAAMLQELQKSAGAEATCRSNENVQVLHTKSPAQSDCCPAQNVVSPAQSPIDHGYQPECECSGCKATARICTEMAVNSLVIPNEMTSEQAYEIGYYYGDPVDVFARGANWMRQHIIDSTLAAAPQLPGSDPATVPGKWIPVSERIPDNTEPVLCIEKRADFGTYGQPFVCWHDGGGWVGKTNYRPIVTHWMPLPAAPQEVKGE
ncbi:Eaa1 [Klebsiella pneumoniae]|nr:DUF551 domain-containing protein [Klebsiella pneumoniae]SAU72907.1 Eaa1 [Klebsiella pneumoniae]